MTSGELALLTDARLSRESRIMGLHIASLGDGEHQVSHETFRKLLGRGTQGMAKDSTIAGYVVELESYGWIDRKPGGQGSPIYIFTPPLGEGKAPTVTHPSEGVKDFAHPGEGVKPPVSPPLGGGQTPPSSSYPLPKPLPPIARAREAISIEAEAAITDSGDLLVGCRGSLTDYLAARVDLEHQHGYVRRLAASLNGADEWMWKDRRGRTLRDGRPALVGAALNELLACSEVGKHFPEGPGGFGNLRAKVRYLVASQLGAEDDAKKSPATAVQPATRQRFPAPEVSRA